MVGNSFIEVGKEVTADGKLLVKACGNSTYYDSESYLVDTLDGGLFIMESKVFNKIYEEL